MFYDRLFGSKIAQYEHNLYKNSRISSSSSEICSGRPTQLLSKLLLKFPSVLSKVCSLAEISPEI